MPEKSYADHIHEHDRLVLQRAVRRSWQALGVLVRDAIRSSDAQELRRLLSDNETLHWSYDSWRRYTEQLGPSKATVQTHRANLYRLRAAALKQIAPFDKHLPDDQLREKYPAATETLRDVEWRLGQLRTGVPSMQPWQETTNRRKLRKWIRRLATRLADARIAGAATAEIEAELQGVTDKERLLALEEYDRNLREWLDETGGTRKRAPRTPAERRGAQGGKRGRAPGQKYEGTIAPKRPAWLVDIDVQDKRDKRIEAPLQPLAPDPRQVRLERARQESDARDARKRAQQHDAQQGRIVELLDWVWGECRLMHVGEEIATDQGTWLYVDDEHGVPRATTPTRAAALAACAVRLSTGWAFPPETRRGRA